MAQAVNEAVTGGWGVPGAGARPANSPPADVPQLPRTAAQLDFYVKAACEEKTAEAETRARAAEALAARMRWALVGLVAAGAWYWYSSANNRR